MNTTSRSVSEVYGYNATTGNLAYKGATGKNLGYIDAAHAHAATSYDGWTYTYDANGNMVTRAESGQPTQTLTYDAENRLVLVQDAPAPAEPVAAYEYDGDGNPSQAQDRLW